ncbi:response regulator [Aequorivita todarodis]|uniref:ATP-binding protein n=1 Tax=Aequorivita todarodis TaxID=2036821 RepID=UPI002350D9F4|nr:ATP-binding protein [Aequorivita todarodis]MDC8000575.1 response regulator [Aequorivita todarodis]
MRFIIINYIAFIFFGSTFLSAQSEMKIDTLNSYVISSDYPIQNLFSKTKILKENTENISIGDILNSSLKNSFKPLEDSVIHDQTTIWLHLPIYSQINTPENWLVLKRKKGDRHEYVAVLDSVEFYFVKNDSIKKISRSGVYVRASQKEIPTPVTVNRIPVNFKEGERADLYIRISDRNAIYPIIELRNAAAPLPINQEEQTNLLSHFAIILGIYVLSFFFFTKDRSYLYLFGFFIAFWIHYQLLNSTLWPISMFFPEHPERIEVVWIISTTLSALFLLQFARKFTDLKQKLPLWDKITVSVIFYLVVTLILRLVIWKFRPQELPKSEMILVGIGFLAILIIVFRIAFYKDLLIRYFVLGVGWMIFWNILGILWQTGVLPLWDVPNPWVIGQGGFMLILSLAIARKLQLSERAKAEVEKVREIDSIKSKFFTNISHEFRTPLSLILGPINKSLENIPAAEAIEENTEVPVKGKHLKVMKRNALRLKNLIDQILELSKLDQGQMKLQVAQGDIIQFLRSLIFSFESLTELKHINFQTHFPKTIANAYYDRDKLEKIVVNLLSNAIKFTPEHGKVSVLIEDSGKAVKISIADSGPGIKGDEVNKIFDRFYQAEETQDQGTGIGLALVKELVALNHGQINVDSTDEKGTVFKVIIPYHKSSFHETEIFQEAVENTLKKRDQSELASQVDTFFNLEDQDPNLPLLLIVEDNPDLRHFIAEQLEKEFKIITAKDGKEGLQIAEAQLPDLVISDVMMPKMTGTDLCEALKKDVKTCHIPIILLTAKAGQAAKLKGLKTGADDYITKPFDGHELLIRSKNLIAQRETLRNKFTGELKIRPTEISLSSMDERFITQVMEKVENNLENEYYSVEDLANSVGFSRSQLNRKLKSLTNKSPNQLIREFRLTRAKEMLEQKSASVSEVAYSVGYSNLSYFSKSYKEAFGELPSET